MSVATRATSVFRAGLFKDKVAIITGGGTGIGRVIAQELVHLGCSVVIASRKFDVLEKASDEIVSLEGGSTLDLKEKVFPLACNIRKEAEVKKLVSTTIEKFGHLDFLVNNGGGQFIGKLEDLSLKGWNAVVETNLTGTYLCCREAYNSWMGQHGGAIVNIVMDFWNGFPMMGHSSAARAAVANLTKTMSIEWAHAGVRVNSVAPGTIYSDTAAANYKNVDPQLFEKARRHIPLKRLGTTEEVSSLVMFLLSPGAAYITGETVKVDAAQSLNLERFYKIEEHKGTPVYRWGNGKENSKL